MADATPNNAVYDRWPSPDQLPPGNVGPEALPPPQPPAGLTQQDVDRLMAERKAVTDPYADTIKQLGAERTRLLNTPSPHPAPPQYQNIPKRPDTEPVNVFKAASPGLIFATVMGSMMMRRHGMGALSAATGFIEGFQKGDQERMERERTKWNDNVDQIIKQNDVERSRYDAVWNNAKLSQIDKESKLQAIAGSLGDAQTMQALHAGNLDFAYKLLQDRNTAAQKLYETQVRYGMGGAGAISDAGLKFMVRQYLTTGDKSVLSNIGRGAQGSQNIARFRNMIPEVANEMGLSPEAVSAKTAEFAGYQAAQRVLQTRGAQLAVASQELTSFAGPAIAASEKVQRGKWVPINKLLLDAKRLSSDPDLRELSNRNAGLISAYAQVISRTGVPTVHAQQRAEELLNSAESEEAYKRAVETLINEADLAEKAPDIIRERLRNKFLGGGGGGATEQAADPMGLR